MTAPACARCNQVDRMRSLLSTTTDFGGMADTCELCGSTVKVQVHHIRAMKDLRKKGRAERPAWVEMMAQRRRKTLVVCAPCHADIHAGRPLHQGVNVEPVPNGEE